MSFFSSFYGKPRIADQKATEKSRILIPGQVAREFAKNRAKKVGDVYSILYKKSSSLDKDFKINGYPLLESSNEFVAIQELGQEIKDKINEYGKVLAKMMEEIRSWSYKDPINKIYSRLFNEKIVIELKEANLKEIKDDLYRRQEHKIPPGFQDSSKEDQGIGDLLIWKTILEIGKEKQKDIVFVSADEKNDWWYQSQQQPLYPRYELVDEFRRTTGGKFFSIINFSTFLDTFGTDQITLQEIAENEEQMKYEKNLLQDNPDISENNKINFSKKANVRLKFYRYKILKFVEKIAKKHGFEMDSKDPLITFNNLLLSKIIPESIKNNFLNLNAYIKFTNNKTIEPLQIKNVIKESEDSLLILKSVFFTPTISTLKF